MFRQESYQRSRLGRVCFVAPAIKATSPDPSRRALLWVQYTFPLPRKLFILATALPLWTERNGEPFHPKTEAPTTFPAAVRPSPCHCEARSAVAISCWLVPASIEHPCHCEGAKRPWQSVLLLERFRECNTVRGNGLPRQCAHWLAMTGVVGGLWGERSLARNDSVVERQKPPRGGAVLLYLWAS